MKFLATPLTPNRQVQLIVVIITCVKHRHSCLFTLVKDFIRYHARVRNSPPHAADVRLVVSSSRTAVPQQYARVHVL